MRSRQPPANAPTQAYSHADVVRWMGEAEVAKGTGYVTAVTALAVDDAQISGLVQGTARRPYQTEVVFWKDPDGRSGADGYCSCPVGVDCKHCAALLLKALLERTVADMAMKNAAPVAGRLAPAAINPAVLEWARQARKILAPPKIDSAPPRKPAEQLFYVFAVIDGFPLLNVLKGRALTNGTPESSAQHWHQWKAALARPPKFANDEDRDILRQLWHPDDPFSLPLIGARGRAALERLAASGRLFFQHGNSRFVAASAGVHPLKLGAPRKAEIVWRPVPGDHAGRVQPVVSVIPPATEGLLLDVPWYLDAATGELGQLDLPHSVDQLRLIQAMPPLAEADLAVAAQVLDEIAPEVPKPAAPQPLRTLHGPPTGILELVMHKMWGLGNYREYGFDDRLIACARPFFRYGEAVMPAWEDTPFTTLPSGETVRVARDLAAEKKWLKTLLDRDFLPLPAHLCNSAMQPFHSLYGRESEDAWPGFMAEGLPELRGEGWHIDIPRDFPHFMLEVSEWAADLEDEENGWLSVNMGIVVEGERHPLTPLMRDLLKRDGRFLDAAALDAMPDTERVELRLPDGRRVGVPSRRLKPIARTLIDLFDAPGAGDALRLSRLDAPRLDELTRMADWQFKGDDAVRELARRLTQGAGMAPVAPPAGFKLTLRPYQLEGLSWLQYLRQEKLSGILADDMGLGKTAQALAHLLLEKESGRLDRPALVVLPTSLLFNWKNEAARFAPSLRLLSLHGKDRAQHFADIGASDVVLTTYPLLWRDIDELARHNYHLLILDEAQTVKNAGSQAAQAVRKLKTRHRLCLTGTPLENHLGELWAQFDFLLPGFLGDSKSFNALWRTPIEKRGDTGRRDLLAKRLKPFILRRRKEDVAKELPPKTLITRTVEILGGQRDLYETVRTAMDKKVRQEIASKGFARSQIVILDALLKLRQVCCDPRLLKASLAAQKVSERAKLDFLMDMLPELVDEGRRALVFSQFTGMLDLIAEALDEAQIPFVMLTGDTQDRETVVRRFQAGEVPVFLISLKAGGVGLNLTAADTVIHFDPWWNPAAENQATDRAHRIGQQKNVFVYKLVVAGSIEEKILALQEKKAALAAGILSEDADGLAKFGASDLEALLAPLPAG